MSFVVHRVAKSAARYTDAGGREKCGYCRFFVAPRACGKVIGPVSPAGWCKYFSRQAVSLSGGGISGGGSSLPPGVTLDLNFMNPGVLDPRIAFTRASTGTYFDSAGVMQTAAINAPRWDYDPVTLAPRGLLLEDQRTNLLLNSATLSTQSVTVTAQAYTLSFYGTGTITKSGTATGALVGTGANQRVSQAFTPTAGSLTLTVTGTVSNAQLEITDTPTSYIPTAGVTVTRAIDVCAIPPANMGFFTGAPGGSWFAEFDFFDNTPSNPRIIGRPDFLGGLASLQLDGARCVRQFDGIASTATGSAAPGVNTVARAVSTWATGQAKVCANGGAIITSAALTTGYGTFTTSGVRFLSVGAALSAENTSGHIRRVSYWPRVLSDAEMQSVTTL